MQKGDKGYYLPVYGRDKSYKIGVKHFSCYMHPHYLIQTSCQTYKISKPLNSFKINFTEVSEKVETVKNAEAHKFHLTQSNTLGKHINLFVPEFPVLVFLVDEVKVPLIDLLWGLINVFGKESFNRALKQHNKMHVIQSGIHC